MSSKPTTNLDALLNAAASAQELTSPVQGNAAGAAAALNAVEMRTRKNKIDLDNQPTIEVVISPMYKPYFGETMPVGLNGLFIYVPCDGNGYQVPEAFAAIVKERVHGVDEMLSKRKRMANVTQNKETFAGELRLIPR